MQNVWFEVLFFVLFVRYVNFSLLLDGVFGRVKDMGTTTFVCMSVLIVTTNSVFVKIGRKMEKQEYNS